MVFCNLEKVELFQRMFLKYVLKVHKRTAKCIVYGETGRLKLENTITKRTITFWHKIKYWNRNKISYIMYNLSEYFYNNNIYKSKWCSNIFRLLNDSGHSHFWRSNNVNLNNLQASLYQKLSNTEIQN